MDIRTITGNSTKQFKKCHIKFPHLDAEILLSFVLQKPREFLLTYPEFQLTKKQQNSFNKMVSRRIKGEPVAYLTGKKGFYGLEFLVNKHTLIPRPETELMVDEALKIIKTDSSKKITLIDIGTGSGCIIVSLAKKLGEKYKYLATDVSKSALNVARKNSRINKVSFIKFISGNLLNPAISSKFLNSESKIIVLANLPYGWPEWKNNSSADTIGLKFEPKIALFTGKNGLKLYEKLLRQLQYLRKTNKNIAAFLEIDPRQKTEIKKLIKQHLPEANLEIKKDLKGHNRLVILKLN